MATVTSSKRHLQLTSDTYESNGIVTIGGDNLYFDGSNTYLRSDNEFRFLTDGGSAQLGKFKSLQLSTSYSGTPPDQGILFGTDTNLYRSRANMLKTDDSLTVSGDIALEGDLYLTGSATTTNQGRMIDFTGFDKEGTTDFTDRAYIQHTTNTGGHAGSVLVISSQNDSGDGIAFLTNASSQLKHNSNIILTSGNYSTTLGSIYAAASHTHAASDITSGTFAAARMSATTRYNIGNTNGNTSSSRDKLRLYNDSNYTIGFQSGVSYGHINSDWAMTFQMNNDADRGWWFGDTGHSTSQGAAMITTEGKMVLAKSLSIGEGETVTSPSSTPLYLYGSGSTVLDIQGSQGQLFSVTDDLTGDIFSVSDISGIPIFNVNASGDSYFDGALDVSGSLKVTGSAFFNGNIGNSPAETPGVHIGVSAGNDGQVQIMGSSAHIDFANAASEDYDMRIILQSNNELGFLGGNLDLNGNHIVGIADLYVGNQIYHDGDPDTYMQFHAANEWRVVTGGSERLEVNNSAVTAANNVNIGGGLTISGSISSGATDYGYYQSAGTNLILKGDSSGRSGIFFESEKDGTNINDPSDYGFIQFHSYGYGGSSGEANVLAIGVANDSTDTVVLQSPYNGGVKVGYRGATSGTGLTLATVFHDNYHPNADKWTTARTVTFSGDISGNFSIDGSANVSNVDLQVANDSHTHDGRYYTETEARSLFYRKDGGDNGSAQDYRFTLNLGGGVGTRWYKVATVNQGSGGLHIRGAIMNHVESFGTQKVDLFIQGREDNNANNIEIVGNFDVLQNGVGIRVVLGDTSGTYDHWDVYVKTTNYSQVSLDLTKISNGFTTDGSYVTTEPGSTVEIDTSTYNEGNYSVIDSIVDRIVGKDKTLAQLRGWVPAYSNGDRNSVRWNAIEDAVELQSSTDTSTGMAYQAVYMKAGDSYRFTVMIKGSVASSTGVYLRIYGHDGNLPDGKTHVSNDAGYTLVQEDDRGDTGWYENNALTTSWVTFERDFTAAASGYYSLVILNWTGVGNNSLYAKTPDISKNTTSASNISGGTLPDVMSNSTRYNIGFIDGSSSQNRDKIRVWNDGAYSMGMKNGYDFGYLGSGEYAMSFQMSNTAGRGWWWGDTAHTDDQGAMSLTTDGRLMVATRISVGNGESATSPNNTSELNIENGGSSGNIRWHNTYGGFNLGLYYGLPYISNETSGNNITGLQVGNPVSGQNNFYVVRGSTGIGVSPSTTIGRLDCSNDIVAYSSSDRRWKENIKTIENPIDKVKAIGGYEFDWKELTDEETTTQHSNKGHDIGVIAQEIEEVLPEVVTTRENGYKGVRYEKITPLLIEAIKEQQKQIDELKATVNKLQNEK